MQSRLESSFVNADIAAVEARMQVLASARVVAIIDRVRIHIGTSNAQIIPLYELERQGGLRRVE